MSLFSGKRFVSSFLLKRKDYFLGEYEHHFEKEHGFFRPGITEVAERYPDRGNPRCGFARICCPMLSLIMVDISPCAQFVPKNVY